MNRPRNDLICKARERVLLAVVFFSAALPCASQICDPVQKIVPAATQAGDLFGESVAIEGGLAAVGAWGDDTLATTAGAVYVLRKASASWTEETKLLASDGEAGDQLGKTVALSGDVIVTGAPQEDDNGSAAGAAYVFRHDGVSWIEEAKLLASDGSAGRLFGDSVDASGDLIVVGARSGVGAAYVFRHDGVSWIEEAKLLASDGGSLDAFGTSVAVSGDTILVGAVGDDDLAFNSGAAYVFRHDGVSWVEEAKLLASDGSAKEVFGDAVALAGDVALVSALGDSDKGLIAGAVFAFRHDGVSWIEEAKLLASDGAPFGAFGHSMALADTGDLAVVGASGGNSGAGAAYLLRHDGVSWIEKERIVAGDAAPSDRFGLSVDLSGSEVLVGARADDDNGSNSGSAYFFECSFNQPPDCSATSASPALLWPPNHGLVSVEVLGVTDPDGDPVTITMDGAAQDEPVDAFGDGSSAPDAVLGQGHALVRSERSGGGDGRVYHLDFTADDGRGGTCSATVTVCVPHDLRSQAGVPCGDQGALHDSL